MFQNKALVLPCYLNHVIQTERTVDAGISCGSGSHPGTFIDGYGADAGDYSLFRGKARSCFPTEDFQVCMIFFICIVFILNAYPYYPRLI